MSTPLYPLDFPCPMGEPLAQADFRLTNADFCVDEHLGFSPGGAGEHVFLQIEKNGENTGWLAKEIAALAGVKENDVGYGGLKDRHAITRQWFSVYLPKGPEPDWQALNRTGVELLAVSRHSHKLRRGQHACNHFRIRLANVTGDRAELEMRLQQISGGVPNYFGLQRFGRDGGNLVLAEQLLVEKRPIKHRQKKSFALSAARSYLFNRVLAERVRQGNWCLPLSGDQLDSAGLPTGPLWGRGRLTTEAETLELEQTALSSFTGWCHGLEFTGLKQERRSLVLLSPDFSWQWQGDDVVLDFSLPAGAFATALVSALVLLRSAPPTDADA